MDQSHKPSMDAATVVGFADLHRISEQAGLRFRVTERGPLLRPDLAAGRADAALCGRSGHLRFASGLGLHVTDGLHLRDMTTEAEVPPGLSLTLFLCGGAEIGSGTRRTYAGASPGGEARGVLLTRSETDWLTRRAAGNSPMRKISLSLSPDWLVQAGLTEGVAAADLRRLVGGHGACRDWRLSAVMRQGVDRLLAACGGQGPQGLALAARLRLESLALELAAQVIEGLLDRAPAAGASPDVTTVSPRDRARVDAVTDLLRRADDQPLSLDDLARQAGMSLSTLQRLFRAVHGTSVADYLRRHRLEEARRALAEDRVSVTEAAFRAGYGSPANFATAFRRHFGYAPRQARCPSV